jgi:RNA polymerase sigma-70 factor (ECF subfamily)
VILEAFSIWELFHPPSVYLVMGAIAALSRVAFKGGSDDDSEDLDLVGKASRGDRQAFDKLIQKYQHRVYHFCFRMVNDVEEAEELTQDVFVKLFSNLKRFRQESKFSTWLFQIAKNLSLNKLKYLKLRRYYTTQSLDESKKTETSELKHELADERKDVQTLFEDIEMQTLVQSKIDALRADYRTALVLRDIEGLSYEEIAKIMKLAEGTVKSRIHRARLELKDSLSKYLR